jgi:mono/diheme cytochrome c family protein
MLAPSMRRLVLLSVLVLAFAGCGGGKIAKPTAVEVQGTIAETTAPEGDPAAGKALFAAQGCGGCHTYTPAGSNGKVGPDLDNLAADAEKAGQPLEEYVRTSIVSPSSYIVPGFSNAMPSYASLKPKEVADLVAFLTQSQ